MHLHIIPFHIRLWFFFSLLFALEMIHAEWSVYRCFCVYFSMFPSCCVCILLHMISLFVLIKINSNCYPSLHFNFNLCQYEVLLLFQTNDNSLCVCLCFLFVPSPFILCALCLLAICFVLFFYFILSCFFFVWQQPLRLTNFHFSQQEIRISVWFKNKHLIISYISFFLSSSFCSVCKYVLS